MTRRQTERWIAWRLAIIVMLGLILALGAALVLDHGAGASDEAHEHPGEIASVGEGGDPVAQADMPFEYWELITGAVLPLVIPFLIQTGWGQAQQALAAFGVSAVATLMQLYLQDELTNFTDPVASVLKVLALTIVFYKGFWKPTGVAPAIERRTSFTTNRAGP